MPGRTTGSAGWLHSTDDCHKQTFWCSSWVGSIGQTVLSIMGFTDLLGLLGALPPCRGAHMEGANLATARRRTQVRRPLPVSGYPTKGGSTSPCMSAKPRITWAQAVTFLTYLVLLEGVALPQKESHKPSGPILLGAGERCPRRTTPGTSLYPILFLDAQPTPQASVA